MSETQILEMPLVRQYLRTAAPTYGGDIVQDAFFGLEEGARQLVRLCLSLRGNSRTRRTPTTVMLEWRRTRGGRATDAARWYFRVEQTLMAMFRTFRTFAFPVLRRVSDEALQEQLPRRARRLLGYMCR